MMLSLLIGNILLIGIVSGVPLYTRATMQRILYKDMQQVQLRRNVHPAVIEFRYKFNHVREDMIIPTYYRTQDEIIPRILGSLDIPVLNSVQNLMLENWYCVPLEPREERPRSRALNLSSYEGHRDHIRLTQGRMPSGQILEGNIIECLANEMTLIRQDLLLNELMAVTNIKDLNIPEDEEEEPLYYIIIVGVYEALDEDLYWTVNPNNFRNELLISNSIIKENFIGEYQTQYNISSIWYIMLDYGRMSAAQVLRYQASDAAIKEEFNNYSINIWNYKENFIETLNGYTLRTSKLVITLWVLQIPIYVLLAFYIYMVSRQILQLEQNDISVLKSRGASRGQIFSIYLLQSLFVCAISLCAGLPLGGFVCKVLGASNGFLDLVSRAALEVIFTRDAFIYAGIAGFVSILMMMVPVVRF